MDEMERQRTLGKIWFIAGVVGLVAMFVMRGGPQNIDLGPLWNAYWARYYSSEVPKEYRSV